MIASLQRISGLLLTISVFAFTLVTTFQVTTLCASGQPNCLSASVIFGVPETALPQPNIGQTNLTTQASLNQSVEPFGWVLPLVQLSSIYLILLALTTIIILEFFELRYLKRLTKLQLRR